MATTATHVSDRLLERDRELEVVSAALDAVTDGAGSLILVEGPAGIGKTSILDRAAALATGRALLVRRGRGGELEREMPFGVARQLFESVVARASAKERARLLAGSAGLAATALGQVDPDRVGPAGDPFAPMHGLYWLVANLAESQPLVLAIDDAHWADAQTLRFLDYLARRLADLAVVVVAGARIGEPDEPAGLERLRLHAQILQPGALTEGAVRELLAAELGADPGAQVASACRQATAGNPFLVTEVVRGLRADAIDPAADATAAIAQLGPETVARHVLVRLGRFGAEAIALARAIAVLGGSPQLRHVARLAGLEEAIASALCDRLREAEILTPGLPIDFVHPLVRQAIYRDLSEGERSALHRRAAEVLDSTDMGADEIAPHLMACAPNGDQWVVAQLGQAAWQAIGAGAFDAGQAFLERALDEPADDRLSLLYGLGLCMLQTDPHRAAEVLTRDVSEAADARVRERALRHAAQGYFLAGYWADAARCHEQLLEILPETEREKRLIAEAELYLEQASVAGRTDEISARVARVAEGLSGATPGELMARHALGFDRFLACAPVDEVLALTSSFPPAEWGLRTIIPATAVQILAPSGRWHHAARAAADLVEAARAGGLVLNQGYFSAMVAHAYCRAGQLADAEVEARTAVALAGETGAFLNPGRGAAATLVAILIAAGKLDEADRVAEGTDLTLGLADAQVSPVPLEVRGLLSLAHGRIDAAVADLLELGSDLEAYNFLNPAFSPWRQEAAPALAALGRSADADELIAVAEERARAFGAPHAIGTVLRGRGLIEPRKRQIDTLRESVAALEVNGPPHELARSLVELGAALRRDGQRRDAREPLRRALDLAHRCGARGVAQRARDELAAAGARPRREMVTGRDALTATEQRIARMAAEGMSNPEIAQALFVTRKTVENHLARIYPKLGISSRGQLAGALEEEGTASR